jgi:hypothetical protein
MELLLWKQVLLLLLPPPNQEDLGCDGLGVDPALVKV